MIAHSNKTWMVVFVTLLNLEYAAYSQDQPRASFLQAVKLVEQNDTRAADELLGQLSNADLIQQGLELLREDTHLSANVRQYFFKLLATREAAKTDEGYRLFVSGLSEPSVRRWSVAGLAYVPVERRGEAVTHLIRVSSLVDSCSSENVILLSLGILERWGRAAESALPQIERIFHDAQCSDQQRSLAAQAMLRIGPISAVITHFSPANRALVLGPIGIVGVETRGQFDKQDSTKDSIRAYVLEATQDESAETRELAFFALAPAYGLDLLVGTNQDGYRLNDEFLAAVTKLATSDPDPSLRTKAREVLDSKKERLERLIRHHENPAKYKIDRD